MSDLNSAFESLGFVPSTSAPQQYHTLKITYPALNLLPDNNTPPYLSPPKDLHFRQRPSSEKYHLTPTNLLFFHRIPVNKFLGAAFLSLYSGRLHAGEILQLMSSLVKAPGQTHLEMVSFESETPEGGTRISYIFRATVSWAGPNRNACPTLHTCRMSDLELKSLLRSYTPSGPYGGAKLYAWLALVKNLVYRESDRACLHVAQNLQASNTPADRGEGARWARD